MKTENKHHNPVSTMCILISAGLLINMLITAVYAAIVTYGGTSMGPVIPISIAVNLLTAFSAGFFTAEAASKRGILWGTGAGLMFGLIILLSGYFLTDVWVFGKIHIIRLAACTASGGIGGILGIGR